MNLQAEVAKLINLVQQQQKLLQQQQHETARIELKIDAILSTVNKNICNNNSSREQCSSVTNGNKGLHSAGSTTAVVSHTTATAAATSAVVAAVYVDNQRRANRVTNFVVTGLPQSSFITDEQAVRDLCSVEFNETADVVHSKRLGKPTPGRIQPLLVVLRTAEQAMRIVSAAKQLRNSTNSITKQQIYIAANLTKAESRAAYELRCQRREADRRKTHERPTQQFQQSNAAAATDSGAAAAASGSSTSLSTSSAVTSGSMLSRPGQSTQRQQSASGQQASNKTDIKQTFNTTLPSSAAESAQPPSVTSQQRQQLLPQQPHQQQLFQQQLMHQQVYQRSQPPIVATPPANHANYQPTTPLLMPSHQWQQQQQQYRQNQISTQSDVPSAAPYTWFPSNVQQHQLPTQFADNTGMATGQMSGYLQQWPQKSQTWQQSEQQLASQTNQSMMPAQATTYSSVY
jgi:hypothetical protein